MTPAASKKIRIAGNAGLFIALNLLLQVLVGTGSDSMEGGWVAGLLITFPLMILIYIPCQISSVACGFLNSLLVWSMNTIGESLIGVLSWGGAGVAFGFLDEELRERSVSPPVAKLLAVFGGCVVAGWLTAMPTFAILHAPTLFAIALSGFLFVCLALSALNHRAVNMALRIRKG